LLSSSTQQLNKGWSFLLDSLFLAQTKGKTRALALIWLAALYAIGILWFGIFFNWGDHTLFFQDWADITGPRTQILRDAVQTLQLPLHISDPSTMHGTTLRFLTVPDTLISPQFLLLGRFSVQRFNFLNVLLFYTLGFVGLLVLRQRFKLSVMAFGVMALLFNFNGNILAHFTVGHMTWTGYFLFPWFAWLVFRLIDGERSWKWTLWMSSLLFVIWLQGSFHQFLWLLLFLGLLALFVPNSFWFIMRAGVLIILMSSFRLFPAILLYGSYGASYITGYPTLYNLWNSLVNITHPLSTPYFPPGIEGVSPWETANFIGVLGVGFIGYFGLARAILARKAPFQKLLLPLGGMLLLSMGQFFGYLRLLPIPLLQGERVGTRIISVVLVFLFIIGAERFQRWLDFGGLDRFRQAGLIVAFGLMGMELWTNLQIWSIPNAVKVYWWVYFDRKKWFVRNDFSDSTYIALIVGGLALTVITFAGLALLAWREKRAKTPATLAE
jgi:hypothetical protein